MFRLRRFAHPQPPVKDVDDQVIDNVNKDGILSSPMTSRQRQVLFRQGLIQIFINYVLKPVYDFFHARTGPKGCRVSGWIRFWYAVIFLYSRTLFAIELSFLIDPVTGVMPYRVTQGDMEDYEWSIFSLAPDSRLLVYSVFYAGWFAGVGLLLGIQPRWCAAIIFWTTHNLHNHNWVLWDNQEHMMRLWAFFLIFMSLDHITIYDGFGGYWNRVTSLPCWKEWKHKIAAGRETCLRKCPLVLQQHLRHNPADHDIESANMYSPVISTVNGSSTSASMQSTSWPMWPFRIFQIYVCYIYLAAGLGKFNTQPWKNGTALWWLWYDGGFGRFFPAWMSEFLFNRMAIVKLQTWAALLIELGCIVTIWIPSLRWYTFLAVVALHVGIELALIMHAFEYLSVVGWASFLVYPNDCLRRESNATPGIAQEKGGEARTFLKKGTGDSLDKSTVNKAGKGGMVGRIIAPKTRKVVSESILIGILLYFFTVDAVPRSEIMEILPPKARWVFKTFLFPTSATKDASEEWGEMAGIHTGAWTVYRGIPPHSDYSLTAVIQYTDGTAPSIWREEDLYAHNDLRSLYLRERYYWTSTLTYYLSKEYEGELEGIPFMASFAMNLAKKYSRGSIKYYAQRKGAPHVEIDPSCPIKSVSLMAHSATGKGPPKGVGLWESVPRSWEYESNCNYVLTMEELDNNFDITILYRYNENESFEEESGCSELDDADEKLHHQYGSFDPKNKG